MQLSPVKADVFRDWFDSLESLWNKFPSFRPHTYQKQIRKAPREKRDERPTMRRSEGGGPHPHNGLVAVSPEEGRPRAPLSRRMSTMRMDGFGREPDCGVCSKTFNLLRRRHHCRGCHIAVCKDCGRKAVDMGRAERVKPQWYCFSCIADSDDLEVVGSRPTITKRLSFSTPAPVLTSVSTRPSTVYRRSF